MKTEKEEQWVCIDTAGDLRGVIGRVIYASKDGQIQIRTPQGDLNGESQTYWVHPDEISVIDPPRMTLARAIQELEETERYLIGRPQSCERIRGVINNLKIISR
jgi:hypothetical protein